MSLVSQSRPKAGISRREQLKQTTWCLEAKGPSPWIMANLSHPSEFVLLGFSSFGELQVLLYGPFLVLYLLAFMGNTVIIVMVIADSHLHTPMYFFLGNFSLLEILVTMTAVPRMLSDLLAPHKVISFTGCMVQFYFYFSLGSTSFLVLSDMALDRFVAICHPLRYGTLMSGAVCARLVGAAWAAPFLAMVPTVLSRAHLNYCHGNIIDHFFCDNAPLLQLSCSDTSLLEFWDFVMALAFVLSSFLVTLVSYGYIASTVLQIPSASGRQKAFSTCGSHLALVFIGYSSTIFLYVRPGKAHSVEVNKTVALVTSILTPFLNPFILTLRNETIKAVLQEQMQKLKRPHRAL
ncbi:olfactory receptor 6V1 isoform X1 [Camelus ferus]|uniref:Olfactory receptor n=2 Tax=Camelus ferus TaxID=419612 RepID=A0A8B8TB18_CAMFR|nr:olfactory receptor 6V1 isoform X1 [Camelus ferus]